MESLETSLETRVLYHVKQTLLNMTVDAPEVYCLLEIIMLALEDYYKPTKSLESHAHRKSAEDFLNNRNGWLEVYCHALFIDYLWFRKFLFRINLYFKIWKYRNQRFEEIRGQNPEAILLDTPIKRLKYRRQSIST